MRERQAQLNVMFGVLFLHRKNIDKASNLLVNEMQVEEREDEQPEQQAVAPKITNLIGSLATAAAFVVPIGGGLLYLAGTLYLWGYYEHWGIDRELFPLNFQEALAYGYTAFTVAGAKIIIDVVKIVFICTLALVVLPFLALLAAICIDWFRRKRKNSKTVRLEEYRDKIKKSSRAGDKLIAWGSASIAFVNSVSQKISEMARKLRVKRNQLSEDGKYFSDKQLARYAIYALSPALFTASLLLITLVCAIFYTGFYGVGQQIAADERSNFEKRDDDASDGWKKVSLIARGGGEENLKSTRALSKSIDRSLIKCGETNCAFLTEAGVEVVKSDKIEYMIVENVSKDTAEQNAP